MTARRATRPQTLLAGLAILVAACGDATATATPGVTGSAGSTAAAATQAPVATIGIGPTFALPSFELPSADEALEALLPDDIAGETVRKSSITGDQLLGFRGSPEVEAVLDQFDKSPSDLSVAFGGTTNLTLIAYRLEGVDGSQFLNTFLVAAGEDGQVTVTDAAYGGKAVKKVVSSNAANGTVYAYTAGDVMYIVGGDDITDALLAEVFSKIG
ncbi:MAG TPA: hypothetical protein VMQ65_08195 [Candidatus Limnocylindria bacterium]|nr:hypothetical protein [Candidatus Limnocylindria bacterium]